MVKGILYGLSLVALISVAGIGISKNCTSQIEKYFPLMEQKLSQAKSEFEQKNYEKVKGIKKEAGGLRFRLDAEGGEWYYLLFEKGRQIYGMYKDICNLEKSVLILD